MPELQQIKLNTEFTTNVIENNQSLFVNPKNFPSLKILEFTNATFSFLNKSDFVSFI